ncbi:MAG: DUF3987 domain-containing protein [Planctomycetaceae bacterium]|nr:DUF3987 domain-containing protein [Planctomycetaceae bacterium]
MSDHKREWTPFPVDALPDEYARFLTSTANAIGCDVSLVALPSLAAVAAAIGGTRTIEIKVGWEEPSILWTATIGESGSSKSPAFDAALTPTQQRNTTAISKYEMDMLEFRERKLTYDRNLHEWKSARGKTLEHPPEEPQPPTMVRCLLNDATVEALMPILKANPRGVLVARDELNGWFQSHNQYKAKGGADTSHWLSMHNGGSVTIDRKTGVPPVIHVPSAIVSLTGGIQPGVLHRTVGIEHRENGLLPRILLAWPPRTPKQWTGRTPDSRATNAVSAMFDSLYGLELSTDFDGDTCPAKRRFSTVAMEVWIDFYDRHNQEMAELTGEEASAFSKLEAYAARLALICHEMRLALNDPAVERPELIDKSTLESAITLVEWLKHETLRVYAELRKSSANAQIDDDDRWARERGPITARDFQQGRSDCKVSEDAERRLNALVSAGRGRWEDCNPGRDGGRPTRRYVSTQPQ